MLIVNLEALSLSPSLYKSQNPIPIPKVRSFKRQVYNFECKSEIQTERGIEFDTGGSFFRHESATGRDLGILAGALHKQSNGKLRVMDAMCGCGIRSLRYLIEAKADFVLANDANDEYRGVIVGNLKKVERGFGDEKRWAVTHFDANRVLTESYLQRDFFDLIDIDSFGSDSMFLRTAMDTLRLGGLLYLTSTDGYSSGGHRPHCSLAAYGAYICPMPCSNEVGLRMLIGGAVREASLLGYNVTPLFSYYSYHGPVFRVMLRVTRGKDHDNRHYGFISYCRQCGNTQSFSWAELGQINCPCRTKEFTVSGPLWTGPLHDSTFITEMLNLAEQWGWVGDGVGADLDRLLRRMLDESDPRLPFGYIKMDEMASRGKMNSPSLKNMMTALLKEGYLATRSHIANNAIKTNCSMAECIKIAKQVQGA